MVRRTSKAALAAELALTMLLGGWVIWAAVVAFTIGVHDLPILGWRIRGGTSSGIEVLFGFAGLAFGIVAMASAVIHRAFAGRGLPH